MWCSSKLARVELSMWSAGNSSSWFPTNLNSWRRVSLLRCPSSRPPAPHLNSHARFNLVLAFLNVHISPMSSLVLPLPGFQTPASPCWSRPWWVVARYLEFEQRRREKRVSAMKAGISGAVRGLTS